MKVKVQPGREEAEKFSGWSFRAFSGGPRDPRPGTGPTVGPVARVALRFF